MNPKSLQLDHERLSGVENVQAQVVAGPCRVVRVVLVSLIHKPQGKFDGQRVVVAVYGLAVPVCKHQVSHLLFLSEWVSGQVFGQIVLESKRRAVLCSVVEQVLQIGGANAREGGLVGEQALGSKVDVHEHMPLQGSGYGVKEPPQGLLAATVLVELEKAPDGRAGALLEMGSAGRIADRAIGGQQGKCLGDEGVAVAVHLVVQGQDSLFKRYC